jgi:hypothetical protein
MILSINENYLRGVSKIKISMCLLCHVFKFVVSVTDSLCVHARLQIIFV